MMRTLTLGSLVAILAVFNMFSQQYYVDRSRGLTSAKSATFVEFPGASEGDVLESLARWRTGASDKQAVITDSYSPVVNSIEDFYASGSSFYTPSADIFDQIVGINNLAIISPNDRLVGYALINEHRRENQSRIFRLAQPDGKGATDTFEVRQMPKGLGATLFRSGSAISVLNRTAAGASNDIVIRPTSLQSAPNDLVFVSSEKGYSAQYLSRSPTALYGLEPDGYFKNATQAAVGRYLLLELLHPTTAVRIEFSATATQIPQNARSLGEPRVFGQTSVSFGAEGRGSMRLLSAPVQPEVIDGRAFVLLDTGIAPRPFVRRRAGLFGLYGNDVVIDPRKVSVFTRNISAHDADFRTKPAPAGVTSFPSGLADPDLLYSGVYEDGWVSERSFWILSGNGVATIDGVIPLIADANFTTLATMFIDGQRAIDQPIGVGEFHLIAPVNGRGSHRIELVFASVQRLPGDDGRIVGALLHGITIVPGGDAQSH